jgi:hypothetical protein
MASFRSMASKFPSTKGGKKVRGRLTLAFFVCSCLSGLAQAQWSLGFDAQQQAGRGLISARHWNSEKIDANGPGTWNYVNAQAGVQWQHDDWSLVVQRSRQVYFKGDANVLILASENERNGAIDTSEWRSQQVKGQLFTLEGSTVKLAKRWSILGRGRIEIEPQLTQIHAYQNARVDLAWQSEASTSALKGRLQRVGTRVYGFDPNDRPDAGWGWGLNVRGAVDHPWGLASFEAINLLSSLEFSNVHYSDRRYDVLEQSQKILVREAPAISGRYGQSSSSQQLPSYWRISSQWHGAPGLSLGWLGLDQFADVQLSYSAKVMQAQVRLETIGLQNSTLALSWQTAPGLSLAVAVTAYKGKNPTWSALSARLNF